LRSIILVIATIVVLGGAFFLYAMLQTKPPAFDAPERRNPGARLSDLPATAPADAGRLADTVPARRESRPVVSPNQSADTADRVIGAGENVWVKTFDKSNRLANEFRAAKYEPKGDLVFVTRPQARFYLDDGAVMLIEADHGQVVIPAGTGQRETMRETRAQAPTRGELYDVTLTLLKSVDATDPVLRCSMNNIVFDNETFRIATEAYTDATGATVPAERVPVTIRGKDYDFDGYGLVIRWNEIDQRLELLEIARGDRLVVKNPGAMKLDKVTEGARGEPVVGASAVPIEVKWAGPLRVVPGKSVRSLERQNYRAMLTEQVRVTQADEPLATADVLEVAFSIEAEDKPAAGRERTVVVSLSGAPAIVMSQGIQARAAVVSFDTASGSATLRSSPEFPQIGLQTADGRTMLAREVQYDPEKGTATLLGPAKFEIALPTDGTESPTPRMLIADASKVCVIVMDTTQREPAIKSVSLAGDVAIDHPELKLNSQSLDITFGPNNARGEPALEYLSAEGAVRASIVGADGKSQRIACESLRLKARQGEQLAAESLLARGNVRIETTQQTVEAGTLEVAFAANDASAGDHKGRSMLAIGDGRVVAMTAEENVSFVSADGGGVWADRITLGKDATGRDSLRVTGKPARLGNPRGLLMASIIEFDPETGNARATGGGQFTAAMAAGEGQSARPATVSWTGELLFDASRGSAEVNDGVTINSDQPDGTQVSGAADALQLSFDSAGDSQIGTTPLAGQRIRDVNLLGNVHFTAQKRGSDDTVQQSMNLFSAKLVYEPVSGEVIVPVGGRMLVEDRRPEEKRDDTSMPAPRGATAFQWSEKLSYSPGDNRAGMNGDVVVVFQPADGTPPMRLNADAVSADLLGSAGVGVDSQLKRVSARGNVRFLSSQLEFSAAETEFRPLENVVVARGDDSSPAVLLDDQGLSKGSFTELWLNTKTQESHLRDFRASVRR